MAGFKRGAALAAVLGALGALIACVGEVGGDRQTSGCPTGEICSADTPDGLTFVGEVFYDSQGTPRLGPVLAGGRFDLAFYDPSTGASPANYRIEIEDPDVLQGAPGEGAFGAEWGGTDPYTGAAYGYDWVSLTAKGPGTTYVRVMDGTGRALMDRVALDVYEPGEIEIVNAHQPDREYLVAGCGERLGVHMYATDGTTRLFDQNVHLLANGETQTDPGYWDCFLYTVPDDVDHVDFELVGTDRTWEWSMPVMQASQVGGCPEE